MSPRRVDPKFKKQIPERLADVAIIGGIVILVVVAIVALFTLQTRSRHARERRQQYDRTGEDERRLERETRAV